MTGLSTSSFRRTEEPGGSVCVRARMRRGAPVSVKGMAKLRLFASAREAAGTGSDSLDGRTVADVLDAATHRYGPGFADVLTTCRIWVNGNEVSPDTSVGVNDEVAVLPPVSGGCS